MENGDLKFVGFSSCEKVGCLIKEIRGSKPKALPTNQFCSLTSPKSKPKTQLSHPIQLSNLPYQYMHVYFASFQLLKTPYTIIQHLFQNSTPTLFDELSQNHVHRQPYLKLICIYLLYV